MKFLGPPSSGSTAGTTFSHNRAGQYTRNRRTPVVGTRTPRQAVVKGNMTLASQAWQTLTALQQDAWTSYATGHPIVDALGQSIKLTGSQFYIKCNAALLNMGQPQTSTPPVSSSVTPEVVTVLQVDIGPDFLITRVPGVITDFVAIAVSKATSLGVNFQKTFTQVAHITADIASIDITAAASAVMGTISLGTKAWLRLTPVNADGLKGTPLIVQTPVTTVPALATPVDTSPVSGHVVTTWTGAPSPADLFLYASSDGGITYGPPDIVLAQTSPATVTALTTGLKCYSRLRDPVSLLLGPKSNVITVT